MARVEVGLHEVGDVLDQVGLGVAEHVLEHSVSWALPLLSGMTRMGDEPVVRCGEGGGRAVGVAGPGPVGGLAGDAGDELDDRQLGLGVLEPGRRQVDVGLAGLELGDGRRDGDGDGLPWVGQLARSGGPGPDLLQSWGRLVKLAASFPNSRASVG